MHEGCELIELASVQEEIWLDHLLYPEAPVHNIGLAWCIQGTVHAEVFERAINWVANHNDALRIVLRDAAGQPRQCILPSVHIAVPQVDLSGRADAAEEALRYMQERFRCPFDLREGLLWSAELIRVSDSCTYWLQRYDHLIMDGFGVTLTVHAVADAYNALLENRALQAPELSYNEFVADDRRYVNSSRFERDREFWCQRYTQIPAPLVQAARHGGFGNVPPSGRVCWHMARAFYDSLTALAARHGFTMAHLMLAAVCAYFSRVSDVDQIVVGVPVHNRATARFKRTLGMFSSIIPLGICPDRQGSFLSLLGEVAAELRRCYRHQRFPLAELSRSLKLTSEGRGRLFDIRLSSMGFSGDALFGDAPTRVVRMHHGVERTPLNIEVCDYHAGEPVLVDFTFAAGAFERSDVEAIRDGMESLLQAVVSDPDRPLYDLPIMGELQRHQVLHEFNDTAAEYPHESLIHELFEAQVRARPGALALVCEAEELTYAQLNQRANRLAHRLLELGVKPDDRVGICVERGVGMVVGILGILKAGGAYVPMDPAYPPQRLAYMLEDSAPVALLTQSSLVTPTHIPTVVLDDPQEAATLAQQPDTNPAPTRLGMRAQHLAYVIYTSGSTGTPKGVMVEHRSVGNFLSAMSRSPGLSESDVLLAVTTLSFDIAALELYLPLVNGARILLAPRAVSGDAALLQRMLTDQGITVMQATPSTWRMLLDNGWQGSPQLKVFSGGEALPVELSSRLRQCVGEVWNLYGPTETTIWSAARRLEDSESPESVVEAIGRPIDNTQIYILDSRREPVPIGVTGELYIGGAGVARGYLNRPELTAERFVEDPFSGSAQGRMYRTGDLGRYRADGTIEYLGRNDFQVKIRGFRIEPGEIEARLLECAGVREAVVLARAEQGSRAGGKRLVAYVVAHEGSQIDVSALREQLSGRLAAHMVPSAFVVLEKLPLTPNGKLDRKGLPEPDQSALASRPYEAPQAGLEATVAGIWRELLGLERVGRHDDFFLLGGHSLHAHQLLVLLRERLAVGLPLRAVFESPTVFEMSGRIRLIGQLNGLAQTEPARAAEEIEEGWV